MKHRNSAVAAFARIPIATLVLAFLCAAGFTPTRAGTDQARIVKYSKEDIVPIRAKLRFSTLIILPDDEDILDFTTGDKEFWIINGAHNLCYVHPAQAGIRSNLNLITASGHVYSFLLTEIGNDPNTEPDLKVFLQLKETSAVAGSTALHGYVRADELEAYKKELDALRAQTGNEVTAAHGQAAEEINKFRAEYQSRLHFDYSLDPKATRDPFLVFMMYHDDAFTYIKCAAKEKPTLYEMKDGKPSLINFQLSNGLYIVPKILDNGYLVVGKKKATFTRQSTAK
jgi:hypothetical protein